MIAPTLSFGAKITALAGECSVALPNGRSPQRTSEAYYRMVMLRVKNNSLIPQIPVGYTVRRSCEYWILSRSVNVTLCFFVKSGAA
jgi:hypothetical protein